MSLQPIRRADLRVAMISMHTSPLDQPGTGDAGGLNVYVAQTARRLAESSVAVDVFTRATSAGQVGAVDLWPGVTVHHLAAGPYAGLRKEDLPSQVCPFTAELLRVAADRPEGYYDLVHSHYWLSGQAGWLAAQRWSVPLVHTMHTMAKVKNGSLAATDDPEPLQRIVGEEQLVAAADVLIANTDGERHELVGHYGADAAKVEIIHPGVDLDTFRPGSKRAARARLGLPPDKDIALFVGRIQPLKAPDLLLRAVAELVAEEPERRARLLVAVCGGLSGNGLAHPDELQRLAADLGIAGIVAFEPPVSPQTLADYYRAAEIVAVPSYSESFGLVALEAQACGTPVLAARVGGLRTAVDDGRSGILVDGHDTHTWARSLRLVLDSPGLRGVLAAGARRHAERFSWSATAAATLSVYSRAAGLGSSYRRLAAVN